MNNQDDNYTKPHKAAVVAAALYSDAFDRSGLGRMEFWRTLDDVSKAHARYVLSLVHLATDEPIEGRGVAVEWL